MAAEERNRNNGRRGRRRGRRRRSNNRNHRPNGIRPEALAAIAKPPRREFTDCPLCSELVRDVRSAIAHGTNGMPAHLECVINTLSEREQIGADERMCYIGAGRFAVIKSKVGKAGLEVVRTIQYEERESAFAWRRELGPGLSRASVHDPLVPAEEPGEASQHE